MRSNFRCERKWKRTTGPSPRIIFKSADLPELYPVARFIMWLKSEGIYEK